MCRECSAMDKEIMIDYFINEKPNAEEVARIFESSGIRRPTHDLPRLQKMIDHANLIVTARHLKYIHKTNNITYQNLT